MKVILQIIMLFLPWGIRRRLLTQFFKFKIHKTSKIGFSIILADNLELDENSSIGNLNFCKNIGYLRLSKNATIGNLNYITGYPQNDFTHFSHVKNRTCSLEVGQHSAITSRHFIDCTAGVFIGEFTTFAGIKSQILTHSIDLEENKQDASKVVIGDYCFVGTGSIILKGAKLPDYSVLGAGALLNKKFDEISCIYGGVPAKLVSKIDKDKYKYFARKEGFVF